MSKFSDFFKDLKSNIQSFFKKKTKYQVHSKEKKAEIAKKRSATIEDKFYWGRAITGILAAIFGRAVFGLVGWWMLLWMIGFWFIWPWFMSFVIFRIPYQKGKWDWKTIMKTGIGIYFFLFMVISTIIHTLILMPKYQDIFANPG